MVTCDDGMGSGHMETVRMRLLSLSTAKYSGLELMCPQVCYACTYVCTVNVFICTHVQMYLCGIGGYTGMSSWVHACMSKLCAYVCLHVHLPVLGGYTTCRGVKDWGH